jgi:hypothetical protein
MYFLISGSGGGPRTGTDRKSQVSAFFRPQWQPDANGSEEALFFIMVSTRTSVSLQHRADLNVKLPSKALDGKMPAPLFITFKLQEPKKSMRDFKPFYVEKALDDIAD